MPVVDKYVSRTRVQPVLLLLLFLLRRRPFDRTTTGRQLVLSNSCHAQSVKRLLYATKDIRQT